MTDEPTGAGEDEREEPVSTPFDNPFFLPFLLWIFAGWFGFDGWFNPEMEWIKFNRGGFVVTLILAIFLTVKAIREKREAAQRGSGDAPLDPGAGD
jgi:hypothetical protein